MTLQVPVGPLLKAHVGNVADSGVISKYAVPQTIFFVDQLDRTSVGKIDKKALRKRYAEE